MFFQGNLLILLAGTLSFIWATPHLQDNGYHDILVFVGQDVPDQDANIVVEEVKELLTTASQDMYYAYLGRAYIKDVTIVVPNHWTTEMVPSLSGVTVRGEIWEEADIQIGRMNKLRGIAPYTHRIKGDCGASDHEQPGEPIHISLEYLKKLHYKRDETILEYGPMGKLITQEFAKYHHGIYEEYGYPGKQQTLENIEKYPSLYFHGCLDKEGNKATCLTDNYCADVSLLGLKKNYKKIGDHLKYEPCQINDRTGEIISDHCHFRATNDGQSAISSMGSYQYTDTVGTFCDGTDYTPHNSHAPNLHNENCEGISQMEVILGHREFADGNNPPVFIEDTTPTFHTKRQASARFVLVIDYSGSMASYFKMKHLQTSAVRWIMQLKAGTYVAIVKFGTSASLVIDWVEADGGDNPKLRSAINTIETDGGRTNMAAGLKIAEERLLDPNAPLSGQSGVVMVFTDGAWNEGVDPGTEDVWGRFRANSIRVATVLMGTKKTADIETLAEKTFGKVFTVNYDGSNLDGTFMWASETWIPKEAVGKEWQFHSKFFTGRDVVVCESRAKQCINGTMLMNDQTNAEVEVTFTLTLSGSDIQIDEYFDVAFIGDKAHQPITSFNYEVNHVTNQAKLTSNGNTPEGEYTIDIQLKKEIPKIGSMLYGIDIIATGHRSSPSKEPYIVQCTYPTKWGLDEEKFLILGKITQGQTTIKGASVYARISKSLDEEPTGLEKSCIVKLLDDGIEQVSGDKTPLDGTHSYLLDPRTTCWKVEDMDKVERLEVMCTMSANQDTSIDDNNFFTKRNMDNRGLPMDNDNIVSPYCCGTSNQTWSKSTKVKYLRSNSTGLISVKNVLPKYRTREEWFAADFGPPGKISDLKANQVGDKQSGVVQLEWTGAGADPGYGTPAYYDVYYSTKRSNLYTKNVKTASSKVTLSMLTDGSLEPVPQGNKMSITVKIPDLEIPETYHFAVRAVDPHGNEGKSSSIASVHFHDGSPILKDMSPHHVHGIPHIEMPLIEKLRKIYPDERIVQGALRNIEKNKKMVIDAENSVMEKRLRNRFGDNEKVLAKIINTIKTNPEQRELFKEILL